MALTRPFTNYNINFTCRCLSAKFCGAIREDGTKEWRRRFTSVFSVTAHCNAQFQVYLSQGFKGNSRASGGNICDLRKAELRSVTVFLCCANMCRGPSGRWRWSWSWSRWSVWPPIHKPDSPGGLRGMPGEMYTPRDFSSKEKVRQCKNVPRCHPWCHLNNVLDQITARASCWSLRLALKRVPFCDRNVFVQIFNANFPLDYVLGVPTQNTTVRLKSNRL